MNRFLTIIILLFCLVYPASLLADECMEGDCNNGIGKGFTEDYKIYSGEWKNGMPHGYGRLYISKGKVLEGRWQEGRLIEEVKID